MQLILIATVFSLLTTAAMAQEVPPKAPFSGQAIVAEVTRMNAPAEQTRWQVLRERFRERCGDLCNP